MNTNPNLLITVEVSQSDVDFWSKQICEHILFIIKFLDPNVAPSLVQEGKELYASWYNLVQRTPIPYNPGLINRLYAFFEYIRNKMDHNPPIYIGISREEFSHLISHYILEQTYYVRLVEDKMTVREELSFWFRENSDHAQFVANRLPCGDLKDQLIEISKLFLDPAIVIGNTPPYFGNGLILLRESNARLILIDNAMKSGQVVSTDLSAEMLEHELREGLKGERRVSFLIRLLNSDQ